MTLSSDFPHQLQVTQISTKGQSCQAACPILRRRLCCAYRLYILSIAEADGLPCVSYSYHFRL